MFADDLHVPVGFELAPEGVYVSQGSDLVLLKDTDGDDHYDEREIIFSGFDDHDTHHTISAFTTDPSGAIIMSEGLFLHTNVETPYGPVRATNGGFYRFQPQRRHLQRYAQIAIPNPWGTAFDDYGQPFFLHTSNPAVRWLMPSTIARSVRDPGPPFPRADTAGRPRTAYFRYGIRQQPPLSGRDAGRYAFQQYHRFSRHQTVCRGGRRYRLQAPFAPRLTAGHGRQLSPRRSGVRAGRVALRSRLHNVLVGHMQHNARDPLRDHVHGRVYRITYPGRPLVEPASIAGADLKTLFDNLKLPEFRTRYRTHRELRGRDAKEVVAAARAFVADLDKDDPDHERLLLEALHATWGANAPDQDLLEAALMAEDYRVRAGAVQVLRYVGDKVENQVELLNAAAADDHGRVRLSALVAATWLPEDAGRMVIATAKEYPVDDWMKDNFEDALKHLTGEGLERGRGNEVIVSHLKGADLEQFAAGWDIYHEDGSCATCHQKAGGGFAGFGLPSPQRLRMGNRRPGNTRADSA